MDDRQLLEAYVRDGSEAAFRELVERHGGLVLGAARQQLGNSALAEDVCQAVFTLLARKAGSLGRQTVVAGWLWQTTRYVAARARRSEERRHKREQEAAAMHDSTSSDENWKRLQPELDRALASLKKPQLGAVLLHYVEDRTHREVGQTLEISEEAAKKQAQRGLESLRRFFARRGHTVSAATLAAALASTRAAEMPAGWATTITSNAFPEASGTAGVTELVSETLRGWRLAKLQMGTAIALVALLGLVGIGQMLKPTGRTAMQPNATMPPATEARVSVDGNLKPQPEQPYLRMRIVAADNGEPVAYAKLAVQRVVGGDWRHQDDLSTDASGEAKVSFPPEIGRLDVGVIAPGYASRYATWAPTPEDPMPQEYTLRVERVARWMGGWLRDENQQPVQGAAVTLHSWTGGDSGHRERPRERKGTPHEATVAVSDASGHWMCAVLPTHNHGGFTLKAQHPAFRMVIIANANQYDNLPEGPAHADSTITRTEKAQAESLRQLWEQKLVTTLDRGITLRGKVLDASGQPVIGAQVVHDPHAVQGLNCETSADGSFAFEKLDPDAFDLAVMADGYAPAYRKVNLTRGNEMKPLEIRLEPGMPLRLKLVDEDGQPVPDATVGLEQWGERRHVIRWGSTSDGNGCVEWLSAPAGEKLELYARKSGWCYTRSISVMAGEPEHVIQMRRALTIAGRVTDGQSGMPVPKFKAFPGYGEGNFRWERLYTRQFTNGEYQVTFTENKFPWHVRIEAEGYEPWESEPITPNHTGYLDVALQRADATRAMQGVVLGTDGKPVDAEVALLTLEHEVDLVPGRFESRSGENLVTRTDAAGRFRFAPHSKAHSVAAVNKHGFAQVMLPPSNTNITVTLLPWGRIEGEVLPEARRRPVASVVVDNPLRSRYRGHVSWSFSQFVASVGEDGRFVLQQVPPLPCWLLLTHGPNKPMTHRTLVKVIPGETLSVKIGCVGTKITARLVGKDGTAVVGSAGDFVYLEALLPELKTPAGLSEVAAELWKIAYWQSPAGLERSARDFGIYPKLDAEGRLEVEELLPGEYRLNVSTKSGRMKRTITVPAEHEPCGIIDLGVVELE